MKNALPLIAVGLVAALSTTPAHAQRGGWSSWREARPVGRPVSCVMTNRIRDTAVRDDRTIDFYMRGGAINRNVLQRRCPGLGLERRFTYRTRSGQLCAMDTITVMARGAGRPRPGATCTLGRFQQVRRVR